MNLRMMVTFLFCVKRLNCKKQIYLQMGIYNEAKIPRIVEIRGGGRESGCSSCLCSQVHPAASFGLVT